MQYQVSLQNMESDIMRDQLNGLYEAVNFIGEGKKQADKKQFELDNVLRQIGDLKFDKNISEHEYQNVRSPSSTLIDDPRARQASRRR